MTQLYSSNWLAAGLLALACASPVHAQTSAAPAGTEQAWQSRQQWAGGNITAADMRVSSSHTDAATGLTYVYVQQLHKGIPVYNRVLTLAFKNQQFRHHAGTFVPGRQFTGLSATPALEAATAVNRALAPLAAARLSSPTATSARTGPDQRQTFAAAGVARRDIVASLVWVYDNAQKLHLAWNVNVDLLDSSDWLNIRVDAATGQVLDQDNWTVHETVARKAPAAATASAARPAAWQPIGTVGIAAVTPATYYVIPYPQESPGSSRLQTESSPWLKAGGGNNATTHGWHFNGSTDFADTRGNNVWAYDDSLKTNAPGRFAASTGASASSLVFDYVPDFAFSPQLGKNRRAATVNLFYWNNIVHDVLYQYGFTEPAGNFQTDNIGRGGTGQDHVRAEAQDGNGVNNANFSTPPDGASGRMQMFLWSAPASRNLTVTAPAPVAGSYTTVESAFSTSNKLVSTGPVTGDLVFYNDPGNPASHLACTSPSSTTLTGKIALIYRGTCNYTDKVLNAQNAGARAVIMVNNAGAPVAMGGTNNAITIPAVMVSTTDGNLLATQLTNGATVSLTISLPAPQLDGDFDNGIVVHEYGHGVSNRLTGGPANASCLGNAEQGGEGWSDYLALMLTTNWQTAQLTDGPTSRAVGTYASGQAPAGGGIRRYPYSTSLSINPLTYSNVATSPESHAIGEVWCAALWDMTWALIQQQGRIEPNLYTGTSTGGNAIALQLVMQGMKLQPCQPGFLDSRDAILAADSLLYNGRYHCLIWSAFARRGMGASAVQGLSTSATDQTAAFDLPGVRLSKNTELLTGNQLAINISATCECQAQQAPYSIKAQLPADLSYVSSTSSGTLGSNNTVTFANLAFTPGQTRTFQIQAVTAAGKGCNTTTVVNDNRETNTVGGFTPAVLTGSSSWAPSTARAYSGSTSWKAVEPITPSDATLTSAAFTPVGFSLLSFYHYYNTEPSYDGGMVAISTDNGATWIDAAPYFLQNGYNSVFDASTASPNKPCFSGISSTETGSAAFIRTTLNLSSFSGQTIRLRFQAQSDEGTAYEGWYVDDIQVINGCGGIQQVQLFTNANALAGSYQTPIFLTPAGPLSAQQAKNGLLMSAVPTPFGAEGVRLVLSSPVAQPGLVLVLTDATGRLLHRQQLNTVAAGTTTITWPQTAALPAGLYLVQAQFPNGQRMVLRVVRE
ncbi:M36 family metallopeptidase [Hymenobacter swuensis]|uniref:T9SS type A sorting domain-containing protein n=1 Tax=Hymenobacter swuensis DY53 TaxID=1227739 RepID=W8EZ86_9BACT|nr:M36 family metallopeptidase [Hymenobacter swuensis]AHJ98409.1 hypothetical protein Hsw_2814 [Hymenobacter swuensis DY53]